MTQRHVLSAWSQEYNFMWSSVIIHNYADYESQQIVESSKVSAIVADFVGVERGPEWPRVGGGGVIRALEVL